LAAYIIFNFGGVLKAINRYFVTDIEVFFTRLEALSSQNEIYNKLCREKNFFSYVPHYFGADCTLWHPLWSGSTTSHLSFLSHGSNGWWWWINLQM